MAVKKYHLILGSQSPRRREILAWSQLPFIVKSKPISEECEFSDPQKFVEDLAKQKGVALRPIVDQLKIEKNPLIITADTIVHHDGRVLGKPKDHDEAFSMLQSLSNKTHQVYTGVMISIKQYKNDFYKDVIFSVKTDVTFDPLTDNQIKNYIDKESVLDKAGAYAIQGKAQCFISHINGSYSNVMGLPLSDLLTHLTPLVESDLNVKVEHLPSYFSL